MRLNRAEFGLQLLFFKLKRRLVPLEHLNRFFLIFQLVFRQFNSHRYSL